MKLCSAFCTHEFSERPCSSWQLDLKECKKSGRGLKEVRVAQCFTLHLLTDTSNEHIGKRLKANQSSVTGTVKQTIIIRQQTKGCTRLMK